MTAKGGRMQGEETINILEAGRDVYYKKKSEKCERTDHVNRYSSKTVRRPLLKCTYVYFCVDETIIYADLFISNVVLF